MTILQFKPILYLKQNCPFCLKVRIYLLEAGMAEDVEVRDFVPGTPQEENIRAEIAPYLDKVSFPSAQLGPERYVAESDNIIAFLVLKSGHEPASLTVFSNYVEGAFKTMMNLWKENQQLKATAV